MTDGLERVDFSIQRANRDAEPGVSRYEDEVLRLGNRLERLAEVIPFRERIPGDLIRSCFFLNETGKKEWTTGIESVRRALSKRHEQGSKIYRLANLLYAIEGGADAAKTMAETERHLRSGGRDGFARYVHAHALLHQPQPDKRMAFFDAEEVLRAHEESACTCATALMLYTAVGAEIPFYETYRLAKGRFSHAFPDLEAFRRR